MHGTGIPCVWIPLPHTVTTNSHHVLVDAWGLINTLERRWRRGAKCRSVV